MGSVIPKMEKVEVKLPGFEDFEGQHVNEEFIRAALKQADVMALRLALCQVTGDKELEAMHVTKLEFRRGAAITYVLSDADNGKVRRRALEYLIKENQDVPPPIPKEEAFRLMDLYADLPLGDEKDHLRGDYEELYEELAFDDFPREVNWTNRPPKNLSNWKVVIVGAGISGIASAVSLKRLGIPFEVIERQSGCGGTWLLNSYPNVRVDSPSYLYQYRFTKRYKWSEYFASGPELKKYLEYVATEFGVLEDMKFNREVIDARWDETTSKWNLVIKHKDGAEEKMQCNAIISASGLFSTPNLPDIKGISSFKGPIFHTSQWNHTVGYTGKDIGLVGTGSTGTQVAPALAEVAKSLTVFQRSPNWVVGFPGFRDRVTTHAHWIFDNMPYYWNWYHYGNFVKSFNFVALQARDDEWKANGGIVSQRNDSAREGLLSYIQEKLSDRPDLIAKVTPKQAPMVRRGVVDNGFYDAIKWDNVELVTDGIERITETGIISKDGKERKFDILVLGAGFKVSQYLWPVNYVGTEFMTLEKAWKKDGARSYLGMVMPNYPNFFMSYGPNHQPRTGSLFSFSEHWARYQSQALVGMIEKGVKSMVIKKDVFDAYNQRLDDAVKNIVWESEGAGYFINEHGRQGVNMPWTNAEYHPMIRKVNFEEFDVK